MVVNSRGAVMYHTTDLATLDELSEGRAILGLGLHTTDMVEWSGYDASDYLQRTREAVDIECPRNEVASVQLH